MHFDIIILGCGAATPTLRHAPTAQAVCWQGKWLLLDAGEGVQTNIRRFKVPLQKIDVVCISHMHGDHVLGLPGLLGSMNLFGREKSLTLIGPVDLEEYVRTSLKLTSTHIRFPMTFVPCGESIPVIVDSWGDNTLEYIPVRHRIEAYGYVLQHRPSLRNIKKTEIERLGLKRSEILELKSGRDVTRVDGTVLACDELCFPLSASTKYVFSGDTAPCDLLKSAADGADALYHEATFLHELKTTAKSTGHSTAKQAAEVADAAQVGALVLGHLSPRYRDEGKVLEEARAIFANTHLANEGLRIRFSASEKPRIDYLE